MKDSTTPPSQGLAILAVGNPGTGKSRLQFAFPNPGILDVDLNLSSAIRVCPGKKYKYSQPLLDCPETTYLSLDDEEMRRWKRSSDLWKFSMKESKELLASPEVDWFVLDGLTKLAEWGLDHCRLQLHNAGINLKKEFFAPYGAFIPLMSSYLTTMRLLRKPIFVTVHQTVDESDMNKVKYWSAAIPGQLKDRIGGLFTDVWGTSTETLGDTCKYFISTRPTNVHVALKTSLDMSPKVDVTGKSPAEIFALLAPKLSLPVKSNVAV